MDGRVGNNQGRGCGVRIGRRGPTPGGHCDDRDLGGLGPHFVECPRPVVRDSAVGRLRPRSESAWRSPPTTPPLVPVTEQRVRTDRNDEDEMAKAEYWCEGKHQKAFNYSFIALQFLISCVQRIRDE